MVIVNEKHDKKWSLKKESVLPSIQFTQDSNFSIKTKWISQYRCVRDLMKNLTAEVLKDFLACPLLQKYIAENV